MSDFPEKTPGTEEIGEGSTVFSDPVAHKKAAPEKKKKLLPKVLAAFLAVAVLVGGTVAVIKLIPEKEEEEQTVPELKTITVADEDPEKWKTVTVTNPNGTFEFYSELSESTDSSESTQTVTWYLSGYPKEAISSSSLSQIVSNSAKVEAIRAVEKTVAECGLDEPYITVTARKEDGEEYSLLIGADSLDSSGVYCKTGSEDTIYLSDTLNKEDFVFDALSLASTASVAAMDLSDVPSGYKTEEGVLSSFDRLTLSGAYFPETLILEPNNDKTNSQFAAFVTVAPTRRIADKVDEILTLFSQGISSSGAYSFDTSLTERKRLGLDAPDLKAEISLGGKSLAYSFKKQEDGNYAVWYDGAILIKKIDAESISFINNRLKDYYANWVYLQSIDELSGFTVKTKDASYEFAIQYDGSEDAEETYVITYNGKKLEAQNFQDFYQYCISLSCTDYTTQTVTGEADITMIYTYSDTTRAATKVEFTKVSETKYQYSVDKVPMGKVASTSLSPLMKYAKKVAEGGSIK